jgi:hypothetical protein
VRCAGDVLALEQHNATFPLPLSEGHGQKNDLYPMVLHRQVELAPFIGSQGQCQRRPLAELLRGLDGVPHVKNLQVVAFDQLETLA